MKSVLLERTMEPMQMFASQSVSLSQSQFSAYFFRDFCPVLNSFRLTFHSSMKSTEKDFLPSFHDLRISSLSQSSNTRVLYFMSILNLVLRMYVPKVFGRRLHCPPISFHQVSNVNMRYFQFTNFKSFFDKKFVCKHL